MVYSLRGKCGLGSQEVTSHKQGLNVQLADECSVDTIGVHYSGTIWRWYRNWIGNADKVKAKYGNRWFKVCHIKLHIPAPVDFMLSSMYPSIPLHLSSFIPDHHLIDSSSDLGILLSFGHNHVSPRISDLLSDYARQESQQGPPS